MDRLAYSVAEAAVVLGWSETSVRRAIADGHLNRVPHTGTRVLIARVELQRFAATGLAQEAS